MLRSGHFKSRLLSAEFLKTQSLQAQQSLQPFIALWKRGSIKDSEMVAIFILLFSFFRRPKDFLGGVHQEKFSNFAQDGLISGKAILDLLRPTLNPEWLNYKSLNRLDIETAFLPYFCSLSLRSIPLSVTRALAAWQQGTYSLKLLTYIPSPEEVMKMQAQGYRCVSMLIGETEISSFIENERDVLGFIIHDLIHADHFFKNPMTAVQQIRFSQKLMTAYKTPELQTMMNSDLQFRNEFHYLMSDMNSVPLHLMKTLKAIVLGFYKRKDNLDWKKPLPPHLESEFLSLFREILRPWDLSPEVMDAVDRLNTNHFRAPQDALLIDSYLQ